MRSGDTLFELAQRFNTSVNAILAANPGIDPNSLRVGQRICIPGVQPPPPTTCPAGTTAYIIRAGDTLFELARRFNTTVNAILAANPGLDPNSLRVGQRICIPGTTPPPGCPTGTVSYAVRAGDTLYRIAQRFNVTINAIIAANPGIDPNRLTVGMVICIPQQQGGVCPGGTTYIIRAGDTFFSIAQRYDVSLNALIAANPGVDPNRLVVGQQICIPELVDCPGNRSYVILPGETLTTIAEKYVVSVDELLAANPGLRPSDFIPGRRICIPLEETSV
ncbi:MAG TPA: LysM peptidoglycan-binding domain-containing protein [Bacillota bacterium]|nr:LysM peptidoglycan-binding domain-containing protein [Bacillota bacterium]